MTGAWRRTAAAAALAAPALMWSEFLGFGLSTRGYNVLLRAASELGQVGAPDRELYTFGFFYLAGAITVVFGAALLRVLPPGPLATLGASGSRFGNENPATRGSRSGSAPSWSPGSRPRSRSAAW